MKIQLENILKSLHILKVARNLNYWHTKFKPNTTHPRRNLMRFYSQFISKGDLCFDIGSNMGQRASAFLELGAKVICLEPQASCLEHLFSTYRNNQNIIILSKAVADKEGISEMAICEDLSAISTMSQKWKTESIHAKKYAYEWNRTQEVCTTTLDILISEWGMPTFCKIDVEGFEETVLKGLTQPIPQMSFEFNAGFFDETQRCIDQTLRIGNYKFNFAIAEPSDGRGLIMPTWSNSEELLEHLTLLMAEDTTLWGDIYAKLS
jgi:FkbM family methyltransferase